MARDFATGGALESFTCGAGTRFYRLHAPPELAGRPRGQVVMLHGCGQDARGFARLTGIESRAAREGLIVLSPEQSRRKNMLGCWNWYLPEHRARGRCEAEILAALARETAAAHGVPPEGIFLAGFSAGAAMALVLRDAYPDLLAAVCVHSGVDCAGVRDRDSAAAAMRGEFTEASREPGRRTAPTLVIHGTADPVVHSANAWRIAAGQGGTGRRPRPGNRLLLVEGGGHAWFGGAADARHGDPAGPDATGAALRFFLAAAPATGLRGHLRRSLRGVRALGGQPRRPLTWGAIPLPSARRLGRGVGAAYKRRHERLRQHRHLHYRLTSVGRAVLLFPSKPG